MKKQNLKVHSVRMDETVIELAKLYEIDIAELFRKALSEELAKRNGKCHACGQKLKWQKV